MENYSDVAVNGQGRPIAGATVTVYDSTGAVATIYSDNSSTVKANPFVTDEVGRISFYAANGNYTVSVAAPVSGTPTQIPIILFDPTDSYFISTQ